MSKTKKRTSPNQPNSVGKRFFLQRCFLEWSIAYWYRFLPLLLITLSAALWLFIFFMQPHKEERFLFPVFPLIALLAGVGIDVMLRILPSKLGSIPWVLLLTYILLCLSRGWALHRNYSGTMEIYKSFHDHFLLNQQNMDFSQMKVILSTLKHHSITPTIHRSFFLGPNSTVPGKGMASISVVFLPPRTCSGQEKPET